MDLFEYMSMQRKKEESPLAVRMRPKNLDEVVGQQHIIGKDKLLYRAIKADKISSLIFYGPPGTGKTTLAKVIANTTSANFVQMNATTSGKKDMEQAVSQAKDAFGMYGKKTILFIDEIHRFNKAQQDYLLPFVEDGTVILIGATTENPYFYVYNAVLSRSVVFEFKQIEPSEIEKALERAVEELKQSDYKGFDVTVDKDAIRHMAHVSNGDVRKALNSLEVAFIATPPNKDKKIHISLDTAVQATQKKAMRYDRDGDSHYDILSAFQKSIRGSDPDAAVHYLARLVSAGDLPSICRRLLVISSEDIGLAYPQAISVVKACVDSALQLGFPEARIPLAEAVILLATAPKSNSAIMAIDSALSDIEGMDTGDIPEHLKDSHYGGAKKLGHGTEYKYPHSYENHYVKQQYLPNNIRDTKYYDFGDNKTEQSAKVYWDRIKKGN